MSEDNPVSTAEEDVSMLNAGTETTESMDGEEEEEGGCGLCAFIKGGECKDMFVAWDECIKASPTGNVDEVAKNCGELTALLIKCMHSNPEYYAPVLKAERKAEAMAEEEAAAQEQKGDASEDTATSFDN